jgi:hypothetical protein
VTLSRWHRRLLVVRDSGLDMRTPVHAATAPALVSGPFAIHRRQVFGEPGEGFLLVHVPTQEPILGLSRLRDCRTLAGELAGLNIRWWSCLPSEVRGPDTPRLAGVLSRWRPRSAVGTG